MADDLEFALKIRPDMYAVENALATIGHNIDVLAGKAARIFHGVGRAAGVAGGMGIGGLAGGIVGGGLGGLPGAALGIGVGGALGGPIGSYAVGKTMDAAGALPGAVGHALNLGLATLSHSLHALQGQLGPLTLGFEGLTGALTAVHRVVSAIPVVGTVLGPLTDALTAVPGLLQDITGSLVNMAEKANPFVFKLWQQALDDTQAVIGRAFVPVLELMTDGVRLFADVLANVLPDQKEVTDALSSLRSTFADIAHEVRQLLGEVGPSIRQSLIEGLKWLAHWASAAALAVWKLARAAFGIAGGSSSSVLRGGVGGAGGGLPEGFRDSTAAAYRPASITGIEEYQRKLQEAFFSLGPGGEQREDPARSTADSLKELLSIEQDADMLVGEINAAMRKAEVIYDKISQGVVDTAGAVRVFAADCKTFFDWVKSVWNERLLGAGGQSLEAIMDREQKLEDDRRRRGFAPQTTSSERTASIFNWVAGAALPR